MAVVHTRAEATRAVAEKLVIKGGDSASGVWLGQLNWDPTFSEKPAAFPRTPAYSLRLPPPTEADLISGRACDVLLGADCSSYSLDIACGLGNAFQLLLRLTERWR